MYDDATATRLQPIGVFRAVKTREPERDGSPYYLINALGFDPIGDRLFEVCFGDGEWMLAVGQDLKPVEGLSLP